MKREESENEKSTWEKNISDLSTSVKWSGRNFIDEEQMFF